MWTITSNDIEQAKDQARRRRAEIERRHAEEKQALDAELAAIEGLERAAAAFALERGDGDVAAMSEPPDRTDPPTAVETGAQGDAAAFAGEAQAEGDEAAIAGEAQAEAEPSGGGDAGGGLDILKPGSRWRLYRGARPTEPEEAAGGASSAG